MDYVLRPNYNADVAFLLRTLQSLCTVSASLERNERALDCVRERLQGLLDCMGGESIYPDRVGEIWTEFSEACEDWTARAYGIAPIARPARARVCNEDEVFAEARRTAEHIHARCTEILDESVRGVRAYVLYPTFYDSVADVAGILCGASEDNVLLRVYLAWAETMRGLIDPSRSELVVALNALCGTCARALRGECSKEKPFGEGVEIYRRICGLCEDGALMGAHPVLADCALRFGLRCDRLYKTGS